MSASEPADPQRVYAERENARKETARQLDQVMDRLGLARLATFGTGLLVVWLIWSYQLSPWWLLLPAAMFLGLVIRYDRVYRKWRRAVRAIRYYERGLDRLADRWHGKGHAGQRFLEEKSLYAQDLDIFGVGSLFERLCIARTRPGEETLARWLLGPAPPEEIRARQAAIGELQPRLDLREDLAMLGAEVPPVNFTSLGQWGAAPPILTSKPVRMVVAALAVCNLITATIALLYMDPLHTLYFTISILVSAGLIYFLARPVQQVLEPIEEMGRELFLLSGVLARLEREPFATPLLARLHSALLVEGEAPSSQIGRLAGLVDWLNSIRNQFFLPLALLLLWRTQLAFAFESWRRRSGPAIKQWLDAIGAIEALSSLAGYAYENPRHAFPEIVAGAACLDGAELGHPLLPRERCVCNDVRLSELARALIVSGSNMSGKSTLLRTVGTNAVLALAGGPVRAQSLRLSPLAIGATLRIQDSLLAGRSRFFAEITRIREIIEHTGQDLPVLFLLDELFHGTNSHDRCIGAEALLRRLLGEGAVGLLTTHDLTLTQVADRLGKQVQNVHFADQFVGGEMHFDYKMRPGVVPHSNALALMRAIGLEV
jgi:hypothetical protein